MSILRINKKKKNFLHKSLDQTNLSWAAKGLHTYLISLPHDSQILVKELVQISKNGRDSVQNLIKELKNSGYITSNWKLDEQFIGQEYIVYECPQLSIVNDLKLAEVNSQLDENSWP